MNTLPLNNHFQHYFDVFFADTPELRDFLQQKNARFIDQTRGFYDADFALLLSDGARFALVIRFL